MIHLKRCEFIGSGYSQIIAPSVPYEINNKNLVYGNEIYKKLLNYKPEVALINEQAFSNSLIKIYKKFYKGIIIDHLNHPHFESDNQEPQILTDNYNNKIPVIWSNSFLFNVFKDIFLEISKLKIISSISTIIKKFFVYILAMLKYLILDQRV